MQITRAAMQQNDDSGVPVGWGEHVSDEHHRAAAASASAG